MHTHISFKTFFRNLYHLFCYDTKREDNRLRRLININSILSYYIIHDGNEVTQELKQISQHGWTTFPYKKNKHLSHVECGYSEEKQLPFVIHKRKKLFFPRIYSTDNIEYLYRNYIENEQLIGSGYLEKAPHCYITDQFHVQLNDIVVDIGAAEGLLSLDCVETACKVYIVEADPVWIPAITATFEPWKDKCIIVNKFVSDHNDNTNIRLDTLLCNESNHQLFIKMDIEGGETNVLNASKEWLTSLKNMKLACCTYHHHNDAKIIENLVQDIQCSYEFSDGYMLFDQYDEIRPPYFRHGVIRAWK